MDKYCDINIIVIRMRKNIFFEERAQADAVFRLLIDSVIGLAILVIILTALANFDAVSLEQSMSDLRSLVVSATQSPDGKILGPRDLSFSGGRVISASDFEYWTKIGASCFTIESVLGSIQLSNSSKTAEIQQRLRVKVFARCLPSSCDPSNQQEEGNCSVECTVSFGKEIQ